MDEQKIDKESESLETEDKQLIKRSFIANDGKQLNYEHQFSPAKKSSNKVTLLLIGLLLVTVLVGAYLTRSRIKSLVTGSFQPTPVPTPVTTPAPTPTPNPLVRPDWSFEVLNGSGETGLAKKVATKIQALGYLVVKTGNADKSNYDQTQILVNKDRLDKVDLVIADLKDTIKIASVAGQLQEGTASARIIIGKDSI